jgi:type II secretory pathway pseudopilin PulG
MLINMRKSGGRIDRNAMTQVELLCTLGILVLLLSLLLPGVQYAREAGRRAQCQSNLRSIVLASHTFESIFGKFPPGYLGSSSTTSPAPKASWVGNLVFLLPYLEQQSLYSKFAESRNLRTSVSESPWWLDNDFDSSDMDSLWDYSKIDLPILQCPATSWEIAPKTESVLYIHTWSTQDTLSVAVQGVDIRGQDSVGGTAYLGVAGRGGVTQSQKFNRWKGVFNNQSKTKFPDITDGSSNTLIYGEVGGTWERGSNVASVRKVSWICGGMPTAWGLGTEDEFAISGSFPRFSSKHAGIVFFGVADGSVKPLSINMDRDAFQSLAAIADGNTAVE